MAAIRNAEQNAEQSVIPGLMELYDLIFKPVAMLGLANLIAEINIIMAMLCYECYNSNEVCNCPPHVESRNNIFKALHLGAIKDFETRVVYNKTMQELEERALLELKGNNAGIAEKIKREIIKRANYFEKVPDKYEQLKIVSPSEPKWLEAYCEYMTAAIQNCDAILDIVIQFFQNWSKEYICLQFEELRLLLATAGRKLNSSN